MPVPVFLSLLFMAFPERGYPDLREIESEVLFQLLLIECHRRRCGGGRNEEGCERGWIYVCLFVLPFVSMMMIGRMHVCVGD